MLSGMCCPPLHRMFFSVKALVFGEDFASDPVSRALGFCLRSFSKGRLTLNLQLFSQVARPPCGNLWGRKQAHPENPS